MPPGPSESNHGRVSDVAPAPAKLGAKRKKIFPETGSTDLVQPHLLSKEPPQLTLSPPNLQQQSPTIKPFHSKHPSHQRSTTLDRPAPLIPPPSSNTHIFQSNGSNQLDPSTSGHSWQKHRPGNKSLLLSRDSLTADSFPMGLTRMDFMTTSHGHPRHTLQKKDNAQGGDSFTSRPIKPIEAPQTTIPTPSSHLPIKESISSESRIKSLQRPIEQQPDDFPNSIVPPAHVHFPVFSKNRVSNVHEQTLQSDLDDILRPVLSRVQKKGFFAIQDHSPTDMEAKIQNQLASEKLQELNLEQTHKLKNHQLQNMGPLEISILLFYLARRGQEKSLNILTRVHNLDFNMRDDEGRTALTYAAIGDHKPCVEILLKRGCLADSFDKSGRTALHWASYYGCEKAVESLIKYRADMTHADFRGQTCFHCATYSEQSKTLQLLLKKYPSHQKVDFQDKDNMTPLMWAAFYGNPENVKILLARGCDPFLKDVDGKNALHWTASNRHPHCAQLLLKYNANLAAEIDNLGRVILHLACGEGNVTVTDLLLKSRATKEGVRDKSRRTPLHWATVRGQVACVKLLLDNKANPDKADMFGATPLHYAAERNYEDCVHILVKRGAQVNALDEHGRSPLMWAASGGHVEVMKLLLEAKADTTTQDSMGLTALHISAYYGHIACCIFLVRRGVGVDTLDHHQQTPLFRAAMGNHADVALALIREGANPHARDIHGRYPLHWACGAGHLEVVHILIGSSVWVDGLDTTGITPLNDAAFYGHAQVVSYLIEHCHAQVNHTDVAGWTALHRAASNGHIETCRVLISMGADKNRRNSMDETGQTPLDVCIANKFTECEAALRKLGALTTAELKEYSALAIQTCWRLWKIRRNRLSFQTKTKENENASVSKTATNRLQSWLQNKNDAINHSAPDGHIQIVNMEEYQKLRFDLEKEMRLVSEERKLLENERKELEAFRKRLFENKLKTFKTKSLQHLDAGNRLPIMTMDEAARIIQMHWKQFTNKCNKDKAKAKKKTEGKEKRGHRKDPSSRKTAENEEEEKSTKKNPSTQPDVAEPTEERPKSSKRNAPSSAKRKLSNPDSLIKTGNPSKASSKSNMQQPTSAAADTDIEKKYPRSTSGLSLDKSSSHSKEPSTKSETTETSLAWRKKHTQGADITSSTPTILSMAPLERHLSMGGPLRRNYEDKKNKSQEDERTRPSSGGPIVESAPSSDTPSATILPKPRERSRPSSRGDERTKETEIIVAEEATVVTKRAQSARSAKQAAPLKEEGKDLVATMAPSVLQTNAEKDGKEEPVVATQSTKVHREEEIQKMELDQQRPLSAKSLSKYRNQSVIDTKEAVKKDDTNQGEHESKEESSAPQERSRSGSARKSSRPRSAPFVMEPLKLSEFSVMKDTRPLSLRLSEFLENNMVVEEKDPMASSINKQVSLHEKTPLDVVKNEPKLEPAVAPEYTNQPSTSSLVQAATTTVSMNDALVRAPSMTVSHRTREMILDGETCVTELKKSRTKGSQVTLAKASSKESLILSSTQLAGALQLENRKRDNSAKTRSTRPASPFTKVSNHIIDMVESNATEIIKSKSENDV